MPTPKRKTARKTRGRTEKPVVPPRVYAHASPRSRGGVALFEAQDQITSETVLNFTSEPDLIRRAVEKLKMAGFDILQVTELTINIAGSARDYERAFNTRIVAEERSTVKDDGRSAVATFLDSPDTELPGLVRTQ